MSSIRRLKPPLGNTDEPTERVVGIGDNGINGTAREKLRSMSRRMDNLDEEAREINEQKKELRAELKALGFDTKAFASARRKLAIDKADREEQEMLEEIYMMALEEQV